MNHIQYLDDILASKLDDEGWNPKVTKTDNPGQVPLADESVGVLLKGNQQSRAGENSGSRRESRWSRGAIGTVCSRVHCQLGQQSFPRVL